MPRPRHSACRCAGQSLPPGEVRRALLEERGHALAEVARLRSSRLKLRLHFELLVERRRVGMVEEPLRQADPTRRQLGVERRELGGARGERVRLDDLGDETPPTPCSL